MPLAAKQPPKRGLMETLFLNGFTKELISVVPPKAPISQGSNITPDTLGKIPGRKKVDGSWVGGWYHAKDIETAQRQQAWGCNIGIETTRLIPIDIDVNDPALHPPLIALAKKHFKGAVIRMGKRPLIILRMKGKCSIGRFAQVFEQLPPEGTAGIIGAKHKIETFFGAKKQFVIHGKHPSGVEYTCTPPLEKLHFEDIPEADELRVRAYMEEAKALLVEKYRCKFVSGTQDNATHLPGEEPPPADRMVGSTKLIKDALRKIPNVSGRDAWVDVCHMVKGATQDRPEEGKQLWLDWCETREDGDPHLREAERVWKSAGEQAGGLWLGIDALLATAGMNDEIARREFEAAGDMDETDMPGKPTKKSGFDLAPLTSMTLHDPSWLIRGVLPDGRYLGALYGPPGSNKSTLATAMAVSLAVGIPFGECKTMKTGKVLMISEEDKVVNVRRIHAWKHYLSSRVEELKLPKDWQQRLDGIIGLTGSFGSARESTADKLAKAVREQVEGGKVNMVFVDTLARTFVDDGDENDGVAMGKYVDRMEALSEALGCPVVIIHHPTKSAGVLRGHSSLEGALSLVMAIDKDKDMPDDGIVRLKCMKMREAESFHPMAFKKRVEDYDPGAMFDESVPEEDRIPKTALVLEPTEWTEIAKGSKPGRGAVGELGASDGSVRPGKLQDIDVLRWLCLKPGISTRKIADELSTDEEKVSEATVRNKLKVLHDMGMAAKEQRGRYEVWVPTETGRQTYSQADKPDSLLV